MMKTVTWLLMLVIGASLAWGQQTKNEVTKAVSVAEDSKPNSNDVPDVIALSGQFSRIVVLRFKYDTDLLAALEMKVKEEKINNAVILAGAGSVRRYNFHVVSNRTFPSKNIYVSDPTGPADIAGMNGYVIDGRVHTHLTLTNAEKAFGGHLESGTTVFTFAVVTLGVFAEGIDLRRVDDKTWR
jgi:predicted DNA-binding protein with PD1-like motif